MFTFKIAKELERQAIAESDSASKIFENFILRVYYYGYHEGQKDAQDNKDEKKISDSQKIHSL